MLNFSSVFTFDRSAMTECYFEAIGQKYVIRQVTGRKWRSYVYTGYNDVPDWAFRRSSGEHDVFFMANALLYRKYDNDRVRIAVESDILGSTYVEAGTPNVISTYGSDRVEGYESTDLSQLKVPPYADVCGKADMEVPPWSLDANYDRNNGVSFGASSACIAATGCAFFWTAQSTKTTYTQDSRVVSSTGITTTPTFTCLPVTLTLFFGPYAEDAIPSEFSACIQLRSASTSQTCSTSPASSRSRAPR